MIIVTAGTADYRDIIQAQARKCAEFGYTHLTFDLGGLEMGEKYQTRPGDLTPVIGGDTLPPATFKAALLLDVMEHAAWRGELVCWLDGDCIPLRPFEPNMGSADVAVTLRPIPEIGASGIPALDYLNSGVAFFRNSVHGWAALQCWDRLSESMNTDQGALNEVIGLPHEAQAWKDAICGSVMMQTGGRALILDAMEWNCWHPGRFSWARIAHFKRGIRGQAVNYL